MDLVLAALNGDEEALERCPAVPLHDDPDVHDSLQIEVTRQSDGSERRGTCVITGPQNDATTTVECGAVVSSARAEMTDGVIESVRCRQGDSWIVGRR